MPRGCPARRDLKPGFVFSHRPAVRRQAARRSSGWKKKRPRGQRVLNGLSGVRVGGRAQAASSTAFHTASLENGIWSNTAMIP